MVHAESPYPSSSKRLPGVVQSAANHRLKPLPITMTTDSDQLQSSSEYFGSKLLHILPETMNKYALLTKLVRSRWLDIDQVLFPRVYGPRQSVLYFCIFFFISPLDDMNTIM